MEKIQTFDYLEQGMIVLHKEFGEGVVRRVGENIVYVVFYDFGYTLGVPGHTLRLVGGHF